MPIYEPIKVSRSLQVPIRGLNYHIRAWGDERDPTLLFLHGGWDVSATFQFLVDALRERWYIVAPDWRGHGQSDWTPGHYELQDYLADLDALIDWFSPNHPAVIVGHSLGGHVGTTYAGVRPDRVRRMVALDGFLLSDSDSAKTPSRLQEWLINLKRPPRSKSYPTMAAMADRLQAGNPRLARDRAEFLASHASRSHPDGGVTWTFDPRFCPPNGVSYVFEQWTQCLRNISAPVLTFSTDSHTTRAISLDEIERRAGLIPQVSFIRLRNVGHNLQYEAADLVALKIEPFLITGELPPREEISVVHGQGVV